MALQASNNNGGWLQAALNAATTIGNNLTQAKPATVAPAAAKPDFSKIALIGGAVLAVIVVLVVVLKK